MRKTLPEDVTRLLALVRAIQAELGAATSARSAQLDKIIGYNEHGHLD